MPDEARIRAALREGPLARRTGEILELARPCVHLVADPVGSADLPTGTSRIGGLPDLPPGTEWPLWKGEPQAFLAQLDLADVAGLPGTEVLPPDGFLAFFYTARQDTWGFDPDDRGSWAVVHVTPGSRLARARPPGPLPDGGVFDLCVPTVRPALSLPVWDTKHVEGLGLSDEEVDAYREMTHLLDGADHHRLLGHPDQIQGDMTVECQLVSHGLNIGDGSAWNDRRARIPEPGWSDWRLLLQVASDEGPGMMWGDAGFLYFWIREQDLARRAFDRVWTILQCT